jgi:hypothetical protein
MIYKSNETLILKFLGTSPMLRRVIRSLKHC